MNNIENSIALHQENIEGFKQIKKRVEESETEQLRIEIQTKHWHGFSEPILLKHHNKIEIPKHSATVLLETAIKLEQEKIDKIIDMEIEKRMVNKANE